jgi:integrase
VRSARWSSLVGERGIVHTFKPSWTEPDGQGGRRKREASTWNWRFEWRKKRYSGGDSYKTRQEAREAGERRMREVKAGLEEDPHKVTFAILKRILEAEAELQTNPGTKADTLAITARLEGFFQHDRLQEITSERIIEYVGAQRRKGRQDSTTRKDLRILARAMKKGQRKGLLLYLPDFPKLKVEPRKQTIPPHELDAIVAQLPEHWVRYYVIADEIGWRARSEIRTRKWTDVDFGEPGWVHLDAAHSKTGKPRSFPMTARLRALLTEQHKWIEALERTTGRVIPTVFAKPDGSPMGDPRKAWASATARAGFGKLEGRKGPWSSARVPHDIRRGVLRRWKSWGEAMDVRKDLAGHDQDATHADYTEGDLASLQAFAERVDERRKADAEKVTAFKREG